MTKFVREVSESVDKQVENEDSRVQIINDLPEDENNGKASQT